MRRLVDEVLEREPDAVIPWTGRHMAVAKFVPHLRNEHAVHRWDIAVVAGREHDPEPDSDFGVRLTSPGQPDLRVVVDRGHATLAWAADDAVADDADATGEPAVDMDAGARQLFIWGRRPDHRGRLRSHLTQPQLARLQALLSGY
jgi:hypothetical protein